MGLNKKGFTLLEVLIVVIIIGILAAIALPQYVATLEKSRSGEAVSNIGAIRIAMDRYWYERGACTTAFANLDIDSPNSVIGRLYNYSISVASCTASTRIYTINAERFGNPSNWVRWSQTNNETGRLLKSDTLGGPSS